MRLGRSSFAGEADAVARAMLGMVLVRAHDGERLAGRIVETEAYLGPIDKAAHSVGWRRTPRTEPMFGPPGTAYVFLTYGMHHCFNVVCREEGFPSAILVRALEPLEGLDTMRGLRGAAVRRDLDLCSGPGKLCRALAIDRRHSGLDLCSSGEIWLEPGQPPDTVEVGPRIGVDYAGEWAAAPLRFLEAGNPHVSRPIRSPGAGSR